jgi:hypothetical protein
MPLMSGCATWLYWMITPSPPRLWPEVMMRLGSTLLSITPPPMGG